MYNKEDVDDDDDDFSLLYNNIVYRILDYSIK